MIGQTISHYKIVAKLGEGGMGVVYKAEDLRLERAVALKFLAPQTLGSEDRKARLLREAKAAAALDHPNICTIYEIDDVQGQTFIAMAFIEGESLDQKIESGPLKLEEALQIAMQGAEGLQEAHGKGIVHRDIKPGNLMVTPKASGRVQVTVMDFGLAHLTHRSTLTKAGTRVGTVCYMSPEQTVGTGVDHRTDLWGLGVVLYEMITAQAPFRGEYDEAVLYSVLNEEPEPVTALRAGLPMELERIVAKALAKRVDERYESASDLLLDLRVLQRQLQDRRATKITRPRSAALTSSERRSPLLQRHVKLGWVLLLLTVVGMSAAALTWWLGRGARPAPQAISQWTLTRVTRDTGLTATPALSPDGTLIAYASDREGEGNLDIWVQQVSGGGAVRLTRDEAADYAPAFSPDGSRLVFHSERDGGGIYIVPTLGGDVRLIAKGGRRPRFSPDGTRIAYYAGPPSSLKGGRLYVVSSSGGSPQPLQADFEVAALPVWAPHGRHLLFWGNRSNEDPDVWVAPLDGGPAVPSGAREILQGQGLGLSSLDTWAAEGNYVVFSGVRQDSVNLWRMPISPETWRITGLADRLTFGADEREASTAAGGRLAFTSSTRSINIWGLPINANQGTARGELERLTHSAAADFSSDISDDGRRVVFRSSRSGNIDVWFKDLETGRETALTANRVYESGPRMSADGAKVAFGVTEGGRNAMYVVTVGSGLAQKVCDSCGPPHSWSSDGTKLVYQQGAGRETVLYLLDIATAQGSLLAEHPDFPLYAARLSSDNRWLTFKGDRDTNRTQVFAARLSRNGPLPAKDWVSITDGVSWDDLPRWSPDGRLIYFTSEREGFRCIWARRFKPDARRPVGEAFSVQHFHRMRLSLSTLSLAEFELAVARDKLVFPLAEVTGNIWLAEPHERE